MSDITKCSGFNCPLKDNCKRYKAIGGDWQYYFTEPPYKDGKCEYFLGDESKSTLKKITLGCLVLFFVSCGTVKKSSSVIEENSITEHLDDRLLRQIQFSSITEQNIWLSRELTNRHLDIEVFGY